MSPKFKTSKPKKAKLEKPSSPYPLLSSILLFAGSPHFPSPPFFTPNHRIFLQLHHCNQKMRLARGFLRSLAAGTSPSYHGFSIARTLATSTASATDPYANATSSETMEEFERSIFGDPGNNESANSFLQKLDHPRRALESNAMNSRLNGFRKSGYVDGLDESFTTLTDGIDGKLKQAATYFKYDVNEVEKDDYKFRPDVTFWPGNTYDAKDLDLTKPGVRKPPKRSEFEVTTEEVLKKADFRNVRFLANFITEAGVIIKRSKTKISAKAQRKVAREIKTARAFGLMPFTTMGTKHFVYGKTMQDLDKDYEYEVYDHNFVDDAP
ncbi:hypothetical protein L1987_22194 [Smallanthus sonchifolius]|uniref:Uncharacterized protein n=1 Tax=Smallanthus sonchifolius TaxID=185202 RepID=A0ACB9IE62_9ASTR|nr:hypothetical protein L1987_22194 [Smallanthus sonchifolius]